MCLNLKKLLSSASEFVDCVLHDEEGRRLWVKKCPYLFFFFFSNTKQLNCAYGN